MSPVSANNASVCFVLTCTGSPAPVWLRYTALRYCACSVGRAQGTLTPVCVYGNRITPGTEEGAEEGGGGRREGGGHKLVQNGGGSQQGVQLSWA